MSIFHPNGLVIFLVFQGSKLIISAFEVVTFSTRPGLQDFELTKHLIQKILVFHKS